MSNSRSYIEAPGEFVNDYSYRGSGHPWMAEPPGLMPFLAKAYAGRNGRGPYVEDPVRPLVRVQAKVHMHRDEHSLKLR